MKERGLTVDYEETIATLLANEQKLIAIMRSLLIMQNNLTSQINELSSVLEKLIYKLDKQTELCNEESNALYRMFKATQASNDQTLQFLKSILDQMGISFEIEMEIEEVSTAKPKEHPHLKLLK
jgi:predicted RNA-binding protein Jag